MPDSLKVGRRERRDYGTIEEPLELPDLIELQRTSFEWFRGQGLKEVFSGVSPITDFTGNLVLDFLDYSLGEPKYSVKECKERDVTYAAPLRVRVRLINKNTGEIKEQEVFMGDLPLLTDQGTFIINGAERVVVSQLVRSPGAYYTQSFDTGGNRVYGCTLIPNRGAWLEMEVDGSGVLWIRVDRTRKLPATVILRALGGGSDEEIVKSLGEHSSISKTLEKDTTKDAIEALIEIYKRLRPGEPPTEDSARSLLESLFFDPKRYDLASVGRYKMNRKLSIRHRLVGAVAAADVVNDKGKVICKSGTEITKKIAQSIVSAGVHRVLVQDEHEGQILILGNGQPPMDLKSLCLEDIVAAVNYLITLPSGLGHTDDIDHLGNRRLRSVGELLQNQFRIGLARMERVVRERMTIQDVDVITPQALINIRPVVASMKEFFGSSQLSQFMDQTNPLSELTHKRRLSALGPGGLSRDRAGFDVRDVHHSHYGRMCPIETPEGPNIGLIGALASYGRTNEYGFIETPYRRVENGKVTKDIVYLTADEEDEFTIAQANTPLSKAGKLLGGRVIARDRHEIVSVSPDEIDYMDVSPKQVVSVATALIPFLENDDANRALMGANMQRQAVPLLTSEAPLVGTGMEYKTAQDSGAVVLARSPGVVEWVDARRIDVRNSEGQVDSYELMKFVRSNQGTCFNQRPIVIKGQKVQSGEIIADGPCTDMGEMALGKNVLVAFMPWEGYNFEDAILISERLVQNDVYTSIHIEEHESEARDTKLGPEEITRDIPNVGEEALKDLDGHGVIRIGAEVRAGDILVGKVTPKGETELTAEERLLRAIFGEKAREVRDTSLRVPHGESGLVVDVRVFSREAGDELTPGVNELVRVYVAKERKISVGDKVAGRHGNKGVIAKILPEEDMPFLPDGRAVEVVLNPLGVPSRMNLGQIMECHMGWAAEALGIHVATPVFDGADSKDIEDALEAAGLSSDGKAVLYDGRTGNKLESKVAVGRVYILKLLHLVDDKIHARSTGPYSLVTQQPLGGKAQFGGQRFGEMEVWALEAYGAAYTLQELLTVKSDDVVGRVKTYEAVVKGDNVPEPGVPESFKVLIKEMQSLCLDVRVLTADAREVHIKEVDENEADLVERARELELDIGVGVVREEIISESEDEDSDNDVDEQEQAAKQKDHSVQGGGDDS